MKLIKVLIFFWLISFSTTGKTQDVYKTPSGKKYHLNSCRMVENVSKKLADELVINKYNLSPCKICKPPIKNSLQKDYSATNKAVGEAKSVQCKGKTKKGKRCKHKTRLANEYCYQHTKQNSFQNSVNIFKPSSSSCGAKNKSGGYCKRKVKSGGYCYQHQ